MNCKKLLSSLLVGATMFAMTTPIAFAYQETVDTATSLETNTSFDTAYNATAYEAPVEYYNIDLTWLDLNWTFVYEGSVTNPTSYRWITSQDYSDLSNNQQFNNDTNSFKYSLLHDSSYYSQYPMMDVVSIYVQNSGNFAINAIATVEQKENVQNYTNPASLRVAGYKEINMQSILENPSSMIYNTTATVSNLSYSDSADFFVKPTATRYVNDNGNDAQVTGEVKITFTKYNG